MKIKLIGYFIIKLRTRHLDLKEGKYILLMTMKTMNIYYQLWNLQYFIRYA